MENFPKWNCVSLNYCKHTEQWENDFFLNRSFKLFHNMLFFLSLSGLSNFKWFTGSPNCKNPIADLKDLRNGLTNILLYFVHKQFLFNGFVDFMQKISCIQLPWKRSKLWCHAFPFSSQGGTLLQKHQLMEKSPCCRTVILTCSFFLCKLLNLFSTRLCFYLSKALQ